MSRYRSIKKKSGGPVPESKDLVKPVTMRPRLATVSSDTDGDEVTDGRSSDLGSDLGHTWEVGPSSEETSTTNPGPRAATPGPGGDTPGLRPRTPCSVLKIGLGDRGSPHLQPEKI